MTKADENETPQEIQDPSNNLLERVRAEAPAINELSQKGQKQVVRSVMRLVSMSATTFSGPLPPPDMLARYNDVVPDGAERILKMAEQQAEHRRALEGDVIREQQKQSGRGQWFGLIIGVCGYAAAVICASLGATVIGATVGGTTTIALATAFIVGKVTQARDLRAKSGGGE